MKINCHSYNIHGPEKSAPCFLSHMPTFKQHSWQYAILNHRYLRNVINKHYHNAVTDLEGITSNVNTTVTK